MTTNKPRRANGARYQLWPWDASLYASTLKALVPTLVDCAARGEGQHVLTLNLDIYRQLASMPLAESESLRSAYTVVLADGMPIVWAAALAGQPVRERVTGADLFLALSPAALAADLHVHLTGGPPSAADRAAVAIRSVVPRAGLLSTSAFALATNSGDRSYTDAAKAVVAGSPDIVFSAYGFPKQDHLAMAVRRLDPSITVIGCGAALEFAAGMVPRAPAALQRTGLEWLFRLGTEPRRLGRRYLVEDLPALRPLAVSALRDRRNRRS
jgi:N-acetylglucosaminyldiphosphoundecaprenol N-acetyl-beta-D-mannosaminyltransferase